MTTVRIPGNPDYKGEVHDGDKVSVPAPNARQAVVGHNVRYVLAISVVVLVAIFTLIYLIAFA